MNSVFEMLAQQAEESSGFGEMTDTQKEAAVMDLREIQQIYSAGCRFKTGDLVTPMASAFMHGVGNPHIVLEVRDEPFRNFEASDPHETGSASFGRRLDMRVACLARGSISAFWTESWNFIPYRA